MKTMASNGTPWADADAELAARLWLEGKSGSAIAKHFPGMSRNAVVAKLNRMGLARQTRKERAKVPTDRMQINGVTLVRV